jgi:iron complex outermembrane receptor protein
MVFRLEAVRSKQGIPVTAGSLRRMTSWLLASTILCCAGAGLSSPSFAQQPASASAQSVAVQFSIPAQPLPSAIDAFIRRTGWQVGYSTRITDGLRSAAVAGTMPPAQALRTLLAGTGINVRLTGANTATLVTPNVAGGAVSVPGAIPLDTIDVQGANPNSTMTPMAPYAGGQVATGGRLGMLGNRSVMDAPFNVTNYTSKLIEDQQAGTVLDVLRNEPSVRDGKPAGGLSTDGFWIRGFHVFTQEVAFDGLYGMMPYWNSIPTEFAERVEVLKGPSALLYGMSPNSAVGGTVNIVPKRAGDVPLTRLTFGMESDTILRTHLDVGRRFGANNEWGLRFNGSLGGGDGYIDGQKKQENTGALALDFRGERLRLTLDAYRVQQKFHGAGALLAYPGAGLTSMPTAPSGRTNILPGNPGSTETTEAAIVGGEYDFNDHWTGYAKLGAQHSTMQGIILSSLTLGANGDGLAAIVSYPTDIKTQSAETGLRGRFQTGPISHALALSASYLHRDNWTGVANAPDQLTNIYAPVANLSWPVAPTRNVPKTAETSLGGVSLADTLGFFDDRILLTLGVRQQNVKATNFNASTGAVSSSYDASAWSPMAGLVVKPTDNLSLYANYVQGLSQGTTVGSAYQNAGEVFPPYKTQQVEAGAKLQTGTFTNTLSVFQITRPSTTNDTSTVPLPTLRLNGEQRNRGIEWTIFGELTPGLRILGGVTYTQGLLTKTQGDQYNGNQAPGAVPWAANMALDWDVSGVPGLALSGRVVYTGRQYVNNANSLTIPSWTRLDLGVRYATKLAGKNVMFRANVDNVFDKNYWQGVSNLGGIYLGAPRTYRLSATVDF